MREGYQYEAEEKKFATPETCRVFLNLAKKLAQEESRDGSLIPGKRVGRRVLDDGRFLKVTTYPEPKDLKRLGFESDTNVNPEKVLANQRHYILAIATISEIVDVHREKQTRLTLRADGSISKKFELFDDRSPEGESIINLPIEEQISQARKLAKRNEEEEQLGVNTPTEAELQDINETLSQLISEQDDVVG
jgi:hypothetical protein